MAIKVGINGFGRIGRLAFRAMVNDPEIEVVAVNDLGDIPTMAHLLKYDSIHGRTFDTVEVTEDGFVADGHAVKVLSEREPANLPWGELGVVTRAPRRSSSPRRPRTRTSPSSWA